MCIFFNCILFLSAVYVHNDLLVLMVQLVVQSTDFFGVRGYISERAFLLSKIFYTAAGKLSNVVSAA